MTGGFSTSSTDGGSSTKDGLGQRIFPLHLTDGYVNIVERGFACMKDVIVFYYKESTH